MDIRIHPKKTVFCVRFLGTGLYCLAVAALVPESTAMDEQEVEASQEERESARWAPERDIRTLRKVHEENRLELGRQARSLAESLRDDDSAAKRATDWERNHAFEERLKNRNERTDVSENRQLNQARVEQDRGIHEATGFSGTELINLNLHRPQRNLHPSSEQIERFRNPDLSRRPFPPGDALPREGVSLRRDRPARSVRRSSTVSIVAVAPPASWRRTP